MGRLRIALSAWMCSLKTLRSTFRPHPDSTHLFMESGTIIYVDLSSGAVLSERVRSRAFLLEANFLHSNHARRLWTLAAGIYAVALLILVATGLFVLKGKKGITGQGPGSREPISSSQ